MGADLCTGRDSRLTGPVSIGAESMQYRLMAENSPYLSVQV